MEFKLGFSLCIYILSSNLKFDGLGLEAKIEKFSVLTVELQDCTCSLILLCGGVVKGMPVLKLIP